MMRLESQMNDLWQGKDVWGDFVFSIDLICISEIILPIFYLRLNTHVAPGVTLERMRSTMDMYMDMHMRITWRRA